jgi:hypothetical protein
MSKYFQFAGTIDSNREFEVKVTYCFWPFLFSDQWFLPRLKIEIKNLSKEITSGSMSLYITDFANLKSLSEISSYSGHFQDFAHFPIFSLKSGMKLKKKIRIESKFLKPGNYILRIELFENIPRNTPLIELRETLVRSNINKESAEIILNQTLDQWKQIGINPYSIPEGQFSLKSLFDLRFNEVIKIHSLMNLSTIYGVFFGISASTFIASGLWFIQKLNINWENIKAIWKINF